MSTEYNGFIVVLLRVTTPTAAHTSAPVAASTGRVVGPQTAHPRGHIPCSALRGLGWGLGPGGSWQARLVPFRPVSTVLILVVVFDDVCLYIVIFDICCLSVY